MKHYPDAASLYLEVRAHGGKYWFWKYRFAGKEKRLALGVYPEVSPRQARLDRDEARKLLKAEDPQDPTQRRREKKLAVRLRTETTFEGVARAWWEQWKGNRSARHADYVLRRLEADVFPEIGASPDFRHHGQAVAGRVQEDRGTRCGGHCKRAFQMSGQVLRYAGGARGNRPRPLNGREAGRRPEAPQQGELRPRGREGTARADAQDHGL